MSVAAIIVAGGRGERAGAAIPKQYLRLGARSVLTRALGAFLSHPAVDVVQPVIGAEDSPLFDAIRAELPDSATSGLREPVAGGDTRQQSVRHGLEALAADGPPEIVLVHDAARPFVSAAVIGGAVEAARRAGAASPGTTVTDTIQTVDADGSVKQTLDRTSLRAIQTPQSFRFDALLAAHRQAAAAGLQGFGDDGALAAWAGLRVEVFAGDPGNVKLTHPADFEAAAARLSGAEALTTRFATGFDVHAFGPGDHLWLGGVRIAASRGVLAHSDGDVVLHALTDALLGTLANGDIGTHFPPSDPQWRGAASDRFLAFAAERVRARGGVIDHLDATVLCEAPRIGPHREAMRARIAAIAGIATEAVSVKATTTEGLGYTGRGEGIAAQAAATVRLPARAT